MRVRSRQALNISNQIIKYIIKAYHSGLVNIPVNEVNSLLSELHVWSVIGLNTGDMPCLSNSKISQVSSMNMARHLYFEVKDKIDDFRKFNDKHGSHHIYGYEFTINPKKLDYENVTDVNSKIVRKLKSNRHIALIERATEHTYCHADINVHLHYLVVATDRINLRQTYRQIKATARKATHGKVNPSHTDRKPYRRVDDWTKAIDYVVKQCGRFPKMMNHKQWQKFQKLTYSQKILLLADDFKAGKGVTLHYLYVNSKNATARRWNTIKATQKYCEIHGVLVKVSKNEHAKAKNERQTVFGVDVGKIYGKTKKRTSRHHYSCREHWIQAQHGNVDLAYQHHDVGVQTTLF